ncbi:hypothetical protein ACHAWF_011047 [Thalassiosira exigua]
MMIDRLRTPPLSRPGALRRAGKDQRDEAAWRIASDKDEVTVAVADEIETTDGNYRLVRDPGQLGTSVARAVERGTN